MLAVNIYAGAVLLSHAVVVASRPVIPSAVRYGAANRAAARSENHYLV